jgi:acetylornithine deacetylase/succinyl-diaminopimelate desuccinylase-like protein
MYGRGTADMKGGIVSMLYGAAAGAGWHESRGALTVRVEVGGTEAHVGQAHLVVNAFAHMVAIAAPLEELTRELLAKRTSFPMEDEDGKGSTMAVGGASGGGVNFNAEPGTAWFSVDRRFNPEEDLEGPGSRAVRRRSSCAPGSWRPAGTPSSASPPSATASDGWTSPTVPASTSTRRPCAGAPRSTRCSRHRRSRRPGRPRRPLLVGDT